MYIYIYVCVYMYIYIYVCVYVTKYKYLQIYISGHTTILNNNTLIIIIKLYGVSANKVHSTNVPSGKIYIMFPAFKYL